MTNTYVRNFTSKAECCPQRHDTRMRQNVEKERQTEIGKKRNRDIEGESKRESGEEIGMERETEKKTKREIGRERDRYEIVSYFVALNSGFVCLTLFQSYLMRW